MNPNQPPNPFDPAAAAEAMVQLVDALKMLSETARGYRQTLINQGWPEPVAEQLAAQLLSGMQAHAMGNPGQAGPQ